MSLRHLLTRIFRLRGAMDDPYNAQKTEGGDHLSDEERRIIRERVKRSFGRAFRDRTGQP